MTDVAEHLEHAARALFVAREELIAYLTAVGFADGRLANARSPAESLAAAPGERHEAAGERHEAAAVAERGGTADNEDPGALPRSWWPARVDELTAYAHQPYNHDGGDAATDPTTLLRRVAEHAGAGDRSRLRAELVRVDARVGLGLSALAPAALRRLTHDLLGRAPGPEDLDRLVATARPGIRHLLPRLLLDVDRALLARVCGVQIRGCALHAADTAITGSVLTGLLLRRAGHSSSTTDRYLVPV